MTFYSHSSCSKSKMYKNTNTFGGYYGVHNIHQNWTSTNTSPPTPSKNQKLQKHNIGASNYVSRVQHQLTFDLSYIQKSKIHINIALAFEFMPQNLILAHI